MDISIQKSTNLFHVKICDSLLYGILVLAVDFSCKLVILLNYIRTVNFYLLFFSFLECFCSVNKVWLIYQVEPMITTELSIHLHSIIWFAKSATYSAVPLAIILKLAIGFYGHFSQRLSRKDAVAS